MVISKTILAKYTTKAKLLVTLVELKLRQINFRNSGKFPVLNISGIYKPELFLIMIFLNFRLFFSGVFPDYDFKKFSSFFFSGVFPASLFEFLRHSGVFPDIIFYWDCY